MSTSSLEQGCSGTEQEVQHSAPDTYVCSICGARKVKLWRLASARQQSLELRCAACLCVVFVIELHEFDPHTGTIKREGEERTNCFGLFIPAVPVQDSNQFWPYGRTPQEDILWWRKLPLGA